MSIINKAKSYAKKIHAGQVYADKPFYFHCKQTAIILAQVTRDENLVAAGFLHDTLEQTQTDYEDLKKIFNEDIANLVREVTKTDYNSFPNLHSQRGVMLKFADRLSNLSNMGEWPKPKQTKYIKKSTFWKI